jgi:hypothetical protein
MREAASRTDRYRAAVTVCETFQSGSLQTAPPFARIAMKQRGQEENHEDGDRILIACA